MPLRCTSGQTKHIGENASEILRRLLLGDEKTSYAETVDVKEPMPVVEKPVSAGIVVGKEAGYEESVDGVKAMRSLLISDEFASSNKAIDRFLLILSSLYRIDHASFAEATQVKGRTRVYFSCFRLSSFFYSFSLSYVLPSFLSFFLCSVIH